MLYEALEIMLSSPKEEPINFNAFNGQANATTEVNEILSTPSSEQVDEFPVKISPTPDYTVCEISSEYQREFTVPVHISNSNKVYEHVNNYDGHIDPNYQDSTGLLLQNIETTNYPVNTEPSNGYVTNNSTRIPPEGMEASSIAMQWIFVYKTN